VGLSNWLHLDDCTVKATTDKAVLVEYEGEEHWIPRSQISDGDELEKGDEAITVSVTEWWARRNGFEVD
jgi:hypothetical protein